MPSCAANDIPNAMLRFKSGGSTENSKCYMEEMGGPRCPPGTCHFTEKNHHHHHRPWGFQGRFTDAQSLEELAKWREVRARALPKLIEALDATVGQLEGLAGALTDEETEEVLTLQSWLLQLRREKASK